MKPLVGVVVPAHQEAARVGRCLDALAGAVAAVHEQVDVAVVTVLDACTDGTARIAGAHGVTTLATDARCVGTARHLGCAALLGRPGRRVTWLASTDADSAVPPDWLAVQLDAWRRGYDAHVGVVDLGGERPPERAAEPHGHVYGANLGVRAGAYLAVGGFPWRPCGEDVALVGALERRGFRVSRTRRASVRTSARTEGRVVGGFATHLARRGTDRFAPAPVVHPP